MNLKWIVIGLDLWAIGLIFVLVLARMAGNQDRAARHAQKRMCPDSKVTITRFGA